MEQQKHFFFAAVIPEKTKNMMGERLLQLQNTLPFRNWVTPEDLHITLAFLGAAPEERLSKAIETVGESVNGFAPFSISIHQLGIFGKKESPRVLWADMNSSSQLQQIRTKVFSACEQVGFKLETRPFRPHVTLARKWSGEEPFQDLFLEQWKELQPDPITFTVSEIALYQTHLNRKPRYEAVNLFS